jgi:signal transduction histidine kinase
VKTSYNTKDETIGVVLVFEDVTKEKEVEEIKNEFISILSHEMKTPLTSITGFSKLLSTDKLGELTNQQKDCVNVIYDEGERLKNLVEEILDIERLEKGKMAINKSLVNVIDIYSDVIDNKIIMKNENVKILKDFPKTIPKIMVDEDKLRQVLINLISNSLKFTESGSITVRVSSTNKEIITDVIDTGIGMKQEELDHIFEKFYQISNHLTRNKGGLGLGLSIVKKILDLHNGHVEVKSKLNKGSTFTYYLPLK